jgi:putative membrane protein
MLKHISLAAALGALIAVPALAQSIPPMETSASAGEKATATLFTEDSVGDVQLGMLGLQKGHNAALRAFARAMVRDHTRTANEGLHVAQQLGAEDVQLKAGDENQVELSHLARYSGAAFDREFASAMIDAHKTEIGTAQHALEFTMSPALRAYLRATLAVDRRHLAMAQAAQQQVGTGD